MNWALNTDFACFDNIDKMFQGFFALPLVGTAVNLTVNFKDKPVTALVITGLS